jgi:hypothetical protein
VSANGQVQVLPPARQDAPKISIIGAVNYPSTEILVRPKVVAGLRGRRGRLPHFFRGGVGEIRNAMGGKHGVIR